MEVVLVIIVLAALIWVRNSVSSDFNRLYREIRLLREDLKNTEQKKESSSSKTETLSKPADVDFSFEQYKRPPLDFIKEEAVKQSPPVQEIKEEIKTPADEPVVPKVEVQKPVAETKPPVFKKPEYIPPKPKPTFFEKHPDLEKFIGENLINKIGIGILVLGIAFFVKYAIDKNWINEIGRVGIGILAGGILIGIAHKLRKTFKGFSSVLIGGGLAVLYFTISIAFHQYHIFNQTAAFIIMIVITAFAVALAISYDRIELAVLALIGGFSTPFIVSTGEGNYKVLFTYLLILNGGMLALAFYKKWNLVNVLCFLFTILIYGGWLVSKCLSKADGPYLGAFLFATTFYLVFFIANIIYNVRYKVAFKAFEIGLILGNTALYYSAGMSILHYYHQGTFQGLFTAVMGVFNFGFAFSLYKKQNIDRNLVYLLIGLVLTFISLAAPVQLHGHYITLFWAAESVLLLWFSQKSGITLVKKTSVIVMVLMAVSLLMDWTDFYMNSTTGFTLFLNKGFITGIICLISVFLFLKLLNNEQEENFLLQEFKLTYFKTALKTVFIVLLYFSLFLEINYGMMWSSFGFYARILCTGIYNFSFLSAGYFINRKSVAKPTSLVFFMASGLCIFIYLVQYNHTIIQLRREYLVENKNQLFFFLHFLIAALFGYCIFIFNQSAKKVFEHVKPNDWIKWITVVFMVYLCSAELNHIVNWISYSPGRIMEAINKQVFKTGYTVLWGLISFILMQQGMKRKDRVIRIMSLSLFFISVLKLFCYDIRGISEAGKIIAFISLGVLLLVVSFMYQRLKKLILEDDSKINDPLGETKTGSEPSA